MSEVTDQKPFQQWRHNLHEIIFEADTPAGKFFDIVLILSIMLSILAVMLDSVTSIRIAYGKIVITVEWVFT
ncbi:MAG: hypothetical protein H8E41_11060 [Desulfobulbaceae bacterium]|uniref:Ion transporter n=1 Tax=Candidatus Desulfobia pelagia TaxID=2841692 RepID=A0A8J6NFH5_9BACT|nr:hypothetical protein [Candidatus Desulfobia pelagia]